ncbi:YjfB family protein [Neobacillus sp. M.A.Huq-85]
MDIASLSMGISQSKLHQDASIAVMKMAMDTAKGQGDMVNELLSPPTQAMEQSVQPQLGGILDIRI